jgi:hypothetical protein
MWKRVLRRIGIGIAVLAAIGMTLNAWFAHVDERRFPPPGTLQSVGDHRLHLQCIGSGKPAAIIEAGAGGWSVHYRKLQRARGASVQVCTYDRAASAGATAARVISASRIVRQH